MVQVIDTIEDWKKKLKYKILNKNEKNKILVVAAHPDDEVLGCGGTIVNGDKVYVMIMCDGESSRKLSKKILNKNINWVVDACTHVNY